MSLSGGAFPFDQQEPTKGYIAFLFAILFVLLAIVLLLSVTSSNGTIIQPLEAKRDPHVPLEIRLDASQRFVKKTVTLTNESKPLEA